jgi:hypothetical protein
MKWNDKWNEICGVVISAHCNNMLLAIIVIICYVVDTAVLQSIASNLLKIGARNLSEAIWRCLNVNSAIMYSKNCEKHYKIGLKELKKTHHILFLPLAHRPQHARTTDSPLVRAQSWSRSARPVVQFQLKPQKRTQEHGTKGGSKCRNVETGSVYV